MTNLDRIREMTAEELAEFLDKATTCCTSDCDECGRCPLFVCRKYSGGCGQDSIAKWLESEVSEND